MTSVIPPGDVGVAIRADGTWQRLGVGDGGAVLLSAHTDYGTWSANDSDPAISALIYLDWDTGGVEVSPGFSPDGGTMAAKKVAGGAPAVLAKEISTP